MAPEKKPAMDGILAPKPFKDAWNQTMGEPEYKAVYHMVCSFYKVAVKGDNAMEKLPDTLYEDGDYNFPDMMQYYRCDLFTFLDLFTKIVGPTARKALEYKEKNPKNWERLIEKMEAICDPDAIKGTADEPSKAQEVDLTEGKFMECMKHWKSEIGIPRDIHQSVADFVPGTANVFRVADGAIGEAYDRALIEAGGLPLQLTPELRTYVVPEEPRGDLLPHGILFAGEGSHYVGMLRGCKDFPAIREKLRIAKKILGYDILDLCLNGPEDKLEKMEFNGPAMYLAGWCAYELFLMDNRSIARRATAMAGMGVGEYVALAVAGVFSFEIGLELVAHRAKAIQELSELITDQAVVSVAGLQEDRTRQLCQIALSKVKGDKEICQIATVLFNRGYTVGGTKKAVHMFKKLCDEDGAMQSKVIKTSVANCTPLMSACQWPMKVKLREHKESFEAPWCHVYFGAQGDVCTKAEKKEDKEECVTLVCENLCKALHSECQWEKIITTMMEEKNISSFYECSPNKQYKAMMKRISKSAFENTHNYTV